MRGRFAPSPTGELHVGNLRTALLAWLWARSAGSEFLIRIEDLDEGRVREPHVRGQLDDLRAIGLDWDGEPVRQSDRIGLYGEALGRLRERARVYRCFCSRREVREAASAAHGGGDRYPGTCAALGEAESDRRAKAGEPFGLRLRAPVTEVSFTDTRRGLLTEPAGDIVLVRRDGAFAYNLAVVVDDAAQGIEQVVRGDDLLGSTADQALVADLLGAERPAWTHVPLVLGPDGERLAKRHGAVTLDEVGVPGALAFFAASLGLGDARSAKAMLAAFDPASVPTEPAGFGLS